MNEPISHMNERDLEDMKVMLRKTSKNKKLIPIPTRWTFIFGGSIIGTSKLSVLSLKKFYVG